MDVQAGLISQAQRRAREAGLTDVVSFQVVEPGPLAFPDESFNMVFCKGMLVHVADKGAIFKEAFRVLKTRGCFVGDDWLLAEERYDEEARSAFETNFISGHGLVMISEQATRRLMAEAGFAAIHFVDRSDWYLIVSKRDLQQMTGPLREQMVALQGAENADRMVRTRQSMADALEGNAFRAVLFRAQKE